MVSLSFEPGTVALKKSPRSWHAAPPALPPLNSWGLLPPGIHDSSWPELRLRFARTLHRKHQWRQLTLFLERVRQTQNFASVYLAGGFITSKSAPSDIDVILQTRSVYGPTAFHAMEPFFVEGLDYIHEKYGIHLHFWCEQFPDNASDFRDFFQEIHPLETARLGLPSNLRKGIVRLSF